MNAKVTDAYGVITLEMCIDIISFLSPDGDYPSYWTNTIDDSNPMSAIVEGVLFVVDYLFDVLLFCCCCVT